jgi:hypothetical protein
MPAVRLPAPSDLNGDQLADELAAAGMPDAAVTLVEDRLEVVADGATKVKVEKVVNAHKPPAEPASPAPVLPLTDDEITRLRALLNSA